MNVRGRVVWIIAALGGLALGLGCGATPDEASEANAALAGAQPVDTPQGGTTAWARRLGGLGDELVVAAAATPDGGMVLVTAIGGAATTGIPEALGLVRLGTDGAIAWSREFPTEGAEIAEVSVAVTGLGNVFLLLNATCTAPGCPDFGGGPAAGPILVKFSPAGAFTWQRLEAGELILSAVAVDANGSAAFGIVRSFADAARILKFRWDGVRLWDLSAPDLDNGRTGWPTAVAFDPAGNLAVGDGVNFGSLDTAGGVRWIARLSPTPINGRVVSIGTTVNGTVVAFVQHGEGTVSWAGTQGADAGHDWALFLAVAEENGAPRFGRVIAPDRRPPVGAAVDPAGRVAILTRGFTGCTDRLERWNLAGQKLWTRSLDGCGTTGMTEWRGLTIDPVSHHVRAAGALWGGVDFGTGPVTSKGGSDDLLLDVMP